MNGKFSQNPHEVRTGLPLTVPCPAGRLCSEGDLEFVWVGLCFGKVHCAEMERGGGNSRSANLGWPALLDVLEAGMQQLVVECIRVVKIEFTLQK